VCPFGRFAVFASTVLRACIDVSAMDKPSTWSISTTTPARMDQENPIPRINRLGYAGKLEDENATVEAISAAAKPARRGIRSRKNRRYYLVYGRGAIEKSGQAVGARTRSHRAPKSKHDLAATSDSQFLLRSKWGTLFAFRSDRTTRLSPVIPRPIRADSACRPRLLF